MDFDTLKEAEVKLAATEKRLRQAEADHETFVNTLQLAKKLDVNTVITFSGCPGGDPKAQQPNWIVSPWPPEFSKMLEWQWRERVTPYWTQAAKTARAAGRSRSGRLRGRPRSRRPW